MMAAVAVPKPYWAEAVAKAVYLHNITPMRAIAHGSPHEAWIGVKPDISHLRVWGCVTFAQVPKSTRKKLDNNAERCIFLGYSTATKQYKLYQPGTRRVIFPQNVVFNEKEPYFPTPE
jgi:hypothetical protein